MVFDKTMANLNGDGKAKEIGARIKVMCEEKGITTMQLAKEAHITEVSLSRYMGGARQPKAVALHNIAVVLGTTTDYLITGEK